jgi:heme-degrading monooxygenase HmoA
MIAKTPAPPYYAVIFTSVRTPGDQGYASMSDAMIQEVEKQPGFLGFESVRNEIGITVSYWKDLDAVKHWRENPNHQLARKKGREVWYSEFKVRICKVERDYARDK